MTNFDLALAVFSVLKQAGTETLIVCAGARNAPLVLALPIEANFKTYNFFDIHLKIELLQFLSI